MPHHCMGVLASYLEVAGTETCVLVCSVSIRIRMICWDSCFSLALFVLILHRKLNAAQFDWRHFNRFEEVHIAHAIVNCRRWKLIIRHISPAKIEERVLSFGGTLGRKSVWVPSLRVGNRRKVCSEKMSEVKMGMIQPSTGSLTVMGVNFMNEMGSQSINDP